MEGFTAATRRQPAVALGHAHAILDQVGALGISKEFPRWAWSLAARAAWDLADTGTARELLAMLDGYQPGQLAPCLRAERDLARARLTASDGDLAAAAAFAAAIAGLREHSTPYHLAHGLLDHAQCLSHLGDDEPAGAPIGEVHGIARRLRCQPLLGRTETIQPASPASRRRDDGIYQSRPTRCREPGQCSPAASVLGKAPVRSRYAAVPEDRYERQIGRPCR